MKKILLLLLLAGCAKEKTHTVMYDGFSWDPNGKTYYKTVDNNLITDGRRADKVKIEVMQGFEAWMISTTTTRDYPCSVRIYVDDKLVAQDSTDAVNMGAEVKYVIP